MPKYHTVMPIHGVDLPQEQISAFGAGVSLTAMPQWIAGQSLIKDLSAIDRASVEQATHAFTVTYDAAALGDPDPDWKGPHPKSIQDSKYELCVLATFALWLAQPSPVNFTVVIHGPDHPAGPAVQRVSSHPPILCHPKDIDKRISVDHLDVAIKLHTSLASISRESAVWTAMRAFWAGLQMNIEVIRYSLFWIGLEALFGPEDGEITYRISQRIAWVLEDDLAAAQLLFDQVKRAYRFRSKIVHGRWKNDSAESEEMMAFTETLARRAMLKVLLSSDLVTTFSGKSRETWLDGLAFQP